MPLMSNVMPLVESAVVPSSTSIAIPSRARSRIASSSSLRRVQHAWRGHRQHARGPNHALVRGSRSSQATQIHPLRVGRHTVTTHALASMARLAPAWLLFGAGAVSFEHVQTSATRSNPSSPRPCASAPPAPLPTSTAGTGLAARAGGRLGGVWFSRKVVVGGRSTMP